jgi:peptidoglycan hydrolase-like protein with peptidoglycan-binding domain
MAVNKSAGNSAGNPPASAAPRNAPARSAAPAAAPSQRQPAAPAAQAPQDRAQIAAPEKEKVQALPDFGQNFGPQAQAKPSQAPAQDPLTGTFKRGMKGDNVERLQELLNGQGAKLETDGKFGKDTARAVREYQEKNGLDKTGIVDENTLARLQGQPAPQAKPGEAQTGEAKPGEVKPGENAAGGRLNLPAGYESLEKLGGELSRLDPRFNTTTPEGRAATALALAIGGTEVFGKGKTNTNFFNVRGGTGNNMLGFAQFNQKYHASKTNTPEKYTKFLGDILNGDARMPNSRRGGNHVAALTEAISSGRMKTGQDLRNFMKSRGFGGSNWQGIDDGWGRNPGLANALAGFLNGAS